ncbi:Phosphate acetyltransferase, partial [Haemophilus influenzae]
SSRCACSSRSRSVKWY